MKRGTLLAAGFFALLVTLNAFAARGAWIGEETTRMQIAGAECTGPAVKVGFAYDGEPDGSSPAVGDVYPIVFHVQNLGNCTSRFGGSMTYHADVRFNPPKRHKAIHNFSYGGQHHAIQCAIVDPSGAQRDLPAAECAEGVFWDVLLKRWEIKIPGGKWRVPAGFTLNVFVPVLAIDAIGANEAVFFANILVQLDDVGAGLDSIDFQQPVLTATRPLQVTDPVAKDITPTSVLLSANMWPRFTGADVYFEINPGPLFDGRRLFPTTPDLHNGPFQTLWANLEPDTQYQWQALLVVNNQVVAGEMQTFRTPPMTTGRWISADQPAVHAADHPSLEEVGRLAGGCQVAAVRAPAPAGVFLVTGLGLCALLLRATRRARRRLRFYLGLFFLVVSGGVGCGGGDMPASPSGSAGAGGEPNTDPSTPDPGRDPANGNGPATPDPNTTGPNPKPMIEGPPRWTFLREGSGLFTVPEGWEVDDKSRQAWRQDFHHVILLRQPDNPGIVVGVRTFLTSATPERVISAAASQASDLEPFEAESGAGEGLFVRFAATATLGGKPVVIGMFSWSTLPNPQGERGVYLAAVVMPDKDTFDRWGGTNTLRTMAYGQAVTSSENIPELVIEGTYAGEETDGFDALNFSIFQIEITVNGDRISVVHSLYNRLGGALEQTVTTEAKGTVIQNRGMLVPSWEICKWASMHSAGGSNFGVCSPGWGATLHMIPKEDGSFLVRMPGIESATLDKPGTLIVVRR